MVPTRQENQCLCNMTVCWILLSWGSLLAWQMWVCSNYADWPMISDCELASFSHDLSLMNRSVSNWIKQFVLEMWFVKKKKKKKEVCLQAPGNTFSDICLLFLFSLLAKAIEHFIVATSLETACIPTRKMKLGSVDLKLLRSLTQRYRLIWDRLSFHSLSLQGVVISSKASEYIADLSQKVVSIVSENY